MFEMYIHYYKIEFLSPELNIKAEPWLSNKRMALWDYSLCFKHTFVFNIRCPTTPHELLKKCFSSFMYVTCTCVIIELASFTNIKCKMSEMLQTAKNGYKRLFYLITVISCHYSPAHARRRPSELH